MDKKTEAEMEPEYAIELSTPVDDVTLENPASYTPQPVVQNGWASGWCESCHKRYTNAPMIDGKIYPSCHSKPE